MNPSAQPIFEERQHIDQWWLKALMLGIALVILFPIGQYLLTGQNNTNVDGNPLVPLVIVLSVIAIISGMLFLSQLVLRIHEYGFVFGWSILEGRFQQVLWEEVESYEWTTYTGWGLGIRMGGKQGTVYAAHQGPGVAFLLKNGSRYLIVTQEEEALRAALSKAFPKGDKKAGSIA
ncbi:MAG: hypothetical protein AAGI38_23000 [Bacteroidota bacterium]